MATNILPIQPLGATASFPRTSDQLRRRTSTVVAATNGGGASWWSPLFGWSSDADYIDSNNNNNNNNNNNRKEDRQDPAKSNKKAAVKSKFTPGSFTEEKAMRLRMLTMETETFHEVMYHSAIAARLATDFPRRSNQ